MSSGITHAAMICRIYGTGSGNTLGNGLNGAGTALSAPAVPVVKGQRESVPTASHDQILGYITVSSGDIAGNRDFYKTLTYRNAVAGTYAAVTVPADAGNQSWVFVINDSGSDIERGEPVKWKAAADETDLYHVVVMGSGDFGGECIGVAQWTIPNGSGSFVLVEGSGDFLVASGTALAAARGLPLAVDANGEFIKAGADTAFPMGRILDNAASAGALARASFRLLG